MSSVLGKIQASASPSAVFIRGLKQTSLSLTLGIFIGSALTSGAVCGVAAALFAARRTQLLAGLRSSALALAGGVLREARTALGGPLLSGGSAALVELVREGRKVLCVGKNYRDHIKELAQLGPEWTLEEEPEPVVFLKPTTSVAFPGEPIVLPDPSLRSRPNVAEAHGVQHEIELGIIIGRRCRHLTSEAEAAAAVAGYLLAIDVTDRDEQTAAKQAGMPWTVSKGHDSFCPISAPFELDAHASWRDLRMWLSVNGERRQACRCDEMIHGVEKLVQFCSTLMSLEPGDVLLTGTPKGVGRLLPGDVVTAAVEGHVQMRVSVVAEGS